MNENKTNINWFPGHMAKTRREIQEKLDLIDIVYEVVDARMPSSSRIPFSSKIKDIDDLIKDKPKVIIMSKKDLCDENRTSKWVKYYEEKGYKVLMFDLMKDNINKLYTVTDELLNDLNEKRLEKGLKVRKYRALVMGIPNVGKSTLINKLTGRRSAGVGNKPGVTKVISWIRINDKLELLDTPGILWPKIDDKAVGYKLASFSAIKDEILPKDEVACFILEYMFLNYPKQLEDRYGVTNIDDYSDVYDVIGRRRGCVIRGNEVDYDKVSNLVIKDLQDGLLGRVTFDE